MKTTQKIADMPISESAILDRMDTRYRAIREAAKRIGIYQETLQEDAEENIKFFETTRASLPLTDQQIANLCRMNTPGAF